MLPFILDDSDWDKVRLRTRAIQNRLASVARRLHTAAPQNKPPMQDVEEQLRQSMNEVDDRLCTGGSQEYDSVRSSHVSQLWSHRLQYMQISPPDDKPAAAGGMKIPYHMSRCYFFQVGVHIQVQEQPR